MKKTLAAAVLTVCALLSAAGAGWSHPPSSISIAYEKADGMLTMTARHSVSDPKTHFIKEFDIFVDGEKVHTIAASSQTDEQEAVAAYAVGTLSKGAVVEVEALCNKFGKMKEKLVIE